MSKFVANQSKPPGSGIKKGQRHVKTMLRNSVKEILLEMNMHPVRELTKLLAELEPKDKARVWIELLKYISPQLSAVQVTDERVDSEEEIIDVSPLTNEQLLEAIKGTKEGPNDEAND